MGGTEGIARGLPREQIEVSGRTALRGLGSSLADGSGAETGVNIGQFLRLGIGVGFLEGGDILVGTVALTLAYGGFGLSPRHVATDVEGKLVEVGADEHGHILRHGRSWFEGVLRQDGAVDHG